MVRSRIFNARGVAVASAALLLGALVVIALPSPQASASEGACSDQGDVTVVVDSTDIGGSIVTGCASGDPATGREALEAAGFVATDSQPGMICAIDAQPDPCPATFEGSFWSYWHSSAAGEWVSYQVGADSSKPARGEIEGWRYNDGSVGPGIAPADVVTTASAPPPLTTGLGSAPATQSGSTDHLVLLTALGLAAVLAALVILFLVRTRLPRATKED